ncbi:MAG: glycosyltransferase family 4 protein [Candidatus Zipacnadales bacterium]
MGRNESSRRSITPAVPAVGVFHPGTQHSYQSALAFQEAGHLAWYATGVYYRPGRWPFILTQLLPVATRQRAEQRFEQRRLRDLDERFILTNGRHEWLVLAAQRHPVTSAWAMRLIRIRNRSFARWAGRHAIRTANVLYGYDTASLEAFQIAREHGIRTILDQTGSYWGYVAGILKDELNAHPHFGSVDTARMIENAVANQPRFDAELELADHVLVGSSFAASTLPRGHVAPHRLHVVPYGADVPADWPAERPSRPSIEFLYAGGLHAAKGIYYLLEAVKRLNSPTIKLTLVGRLALGEKALKPYQPWITYVPHVPRSQLFRMYREADAFVFPALSEGFGIVLIEAAAHGLPLIATTSTGAPDLIGEGQGGFLIPPRQVEALAAAMEQFATLPRRARLAMGAEAYTRAKQFSWAAYRQHLREVVLGTSTAPHQA